MAGGHEDMILDNAFILVGHDQKKKATRDPSLRR
jgi:hypothetical protein